MCRPLTLRKHLTVSHAGQKKAYPLTVISNKPFEESEVTKWCRNMHKVCIIKRTLSSRRSKLTKLN